MPDLTILGLPADVAPDDMLRQCTPVYGLAVVKAMTPSGDYVYLTAVTENMDLVAALGLINYAGIKFGHALGRQL